MQQWLHNQYRDINTKINKAPPSAPKKKSGKQSEVPFHILSEFDIKAYKTEQVRAALKLTTNKGILALKQVKLTPDHLNFITESVSYLHQRHFHKIITYLPLKSGRYYYHDKFNSYILTKWIKGKESNMADPRQEYEAAVTMAQFHKASRGIQHSVNISRVGRLGYLEKDLEQYVRELGLFTALIKTNPFPIPKKLAKLIIAYNDSFHQDAETALGKLNKFGYSRYLPKAEHTFSLIHQDFAYHNLIWVNGEIYLIDLDYLSFDLRCIDLVKFLRRNLRMSNWKMRVADNIINGYTSVLPLDPEEFTLIYILLRFPYKYWQGLHLYFFENRKQGSKRLSRNIKKLVEQQKEKDIFLKSFSQKYLLCAHI